MQNKNNIAVFVCIPLLILCIISGLYISVYYLRSLYLCVLSQVAISLCIAFTLSEIYFCLMMFSLTAFKECIIFISDTEETLLNPYLAWNTPRLSIPAAYPLQLVHNHAHFTYKVLMPDVAYALDSNTSFSWQLSMVTLSTRSRCEYYTVQSPLRHNSRPDDGPVQGSKHVVLVINTPLPY
jgi:hypothetical protein